MNPRYTPAEIYFDKLVSDISTDSQKQADHRLFTIEIKKLREKIVEQEKKDKSKATIVLNYLLQTGYFDSPLNICLLSSADPVVRNYFETNPEMTAKLQQDLKDSMGFYSLPLEAINGTKLCVLQLYKATVAYAYDNQNVIAAESGLLDALRAECDAAIDQLKTSKDTAPLIKKIEDYAASLINYHWELGAIYAGKYLTEAANALNDNPTLDPEDATAFDSLKLQGLCAYLLATQLHSKPHSQEISKERINQDYALLFKDDPRLKKLDWSNPKKAWPECIDILKQSYRELYKDQFKSKLDFATKYALDIIKSMDAKQEQPDKKKPSLLQSHHLHKPADDSKLKKEKDDFMKKMGQKRHKRSASL